MQLELCDVAPANWKRLPIAAVCQRFTSGGTPSRKMPHYFSGGTIPWVKTQELTDCVLTETNEYITEDAVRNSSAKLLPANTVLMAMYGATVGQLGVLARPMTCNQACAAMVANPSKCDYRFLYYQLLAAREQIKSLSTGAAQQNLSGAQIKQFVLPFPALTEQSEIAEVLWKIDRRIDLLRQTNATLESIAQALFKSWFIDFDPVRAKQAGREPEGMDAATAALFPAEFEESALGWIPKGWRICPFAETVNIIGGGTPKTSVTDYWGGDIPWFSVVDAPAVGQVFTVTTEKSVTKLGVDNSSTRILPKWTTIISARGTVGKLALTGVEMAMNQSCYGLTPRASGGETATYLAAQRLVEDLRRLAHGGVFDTITRDTLNSVLVCDPPPEIIKAFDALTRPLFERILANGLQSCSLTETRDTLLPRLISGKLRLPEAREQFDEATA
ncbi:restriction endonuclease subunit S [Tibeticola sp.]|uniref:restriction endonuclease subunit S n=1 Tax=Tibeticola sp. TaxID=2005368 RepID=UPI0025EA44CC|nr:restriction endonuclease subunit S [Tibeticola sp.]